MSYHELVENQRRFFLEGTPRSLSHRKTQLRALKTLITENSEALCDAVYRDLKRHPKTTFTLEVGMCLTEIDYILDNLDDWVQPQKVQKTMTTLLDTPMIVKDPKGVVLIIAPWNYPLSMVLLPVIPALAAGNTVVIKPSEMAPNTAKVFEDVFEKHFEKRIVTVVTGGVAETTELLKERFDHILYTGCPPVAKIIMTAAARHLTPVTLELGGKCPVIVEDDADIATSGRRIAWGKWLNNGQTCLAPDYVLVSPRSKAALVDALRNSIQEFYGSDIRNSKDYSRIINQRHFDRISSLLDKSKAPVLFSGGDCDREDLFIPPTIIDASKDDAFMEDEIFGPVLPIVTVANLDEALEFIRKGEKPLAAYIFTRSESKVKRLYEETSSGGITVNDVLMHLTVDTLPFGGVGTSGMGRYRGKFGFDTFTHEKSVLKRGFFGESLLAARYPPQTEEKFKRLVSMTGTRRALPAWIAQWAPTIPVILVSILVGVLIQKYSATAR